MEKRAKEEVNEVVDTYTPRLDGNVPFPLFRRAGHLTGGGLRIDRGAAGRTAGRRTSFSHELLAVAFKTIEAGLRRRGRKTGCAIEKQDGRSLRPALISHDDAPCNSFLQWHAFICGTVGPANYTHAHVRTYVRSLSPVRASTYFRKII